MAENNERLKPSKYYPFKERDEIGPGPRGQINRRTDRWRCRCEKQDKNTSVCVCRAIKTAAGRLSRARKRFKVNLAKKRRYGTMYRKWQKEQ